MSLLASNFYAFLIDRFCGFLKDKNKVKKTAPNAVFLGEGIFTMGYSKNYIMYWGGFYRYYNSMVIRISVHKINKSCYSFLCIFTTVNPPDTYFYARADHFGPISKPVF